MQIFQKSLLVLALIIFLCTIAPTTKSATDTTVQWRSLSEVHTLLQQQPKKLLIDIYTDWCGWCKRMDRDTYANPNIARYINTHFYAVKLNAETRQPIQFGNQTFKFIDDGHGGGVNELAAELTNGKLMLPTTVLLDEQIANRLIIQSYQGPTDMDAIMHFYTSGAYAKGEAWDAYHKSYKSTIAPQ